MKLLLTIIMSTVVSASAFGACGVTAPNSPKDCSTKSTCEGLSTAGGMKFTFSDTTTPKCMTVDTSVATNCLQVNDGSLGKDTAATTTPSGASGTEVKSR